MQAKVSDIAAMLQGTVEGNGDLLLDSICKIEEGSPTALSFLANPKYTPFIYSTKAGAVLVSHDFVPEQSISATLIRVADPYAAFTAILEMVQKLQKKSGIEPLAFIDPKASIGSDAYIGGFAYISAGAKIGKEVSIYPHVFIGDDVTIGDNCTLYAGVKIYAGCKLGNNVMLHAGTVIGSDGFGHAPQPDGSYKKIPQTGNVIIEDDVEIGANCTIDRATLGSTIIRKGVKLDNLIQVAHNVEIGENTVIAAQTGISGSTKLGRQCMIGGQVGFVGHITVADGSQIGAQSGIPNSIKDPGKAWIGSPIMELKTAFRAQVVVKRLPDLEKKITELEREIKRLSETK